MAYQPAVCGSSLNSSQNTKSHYDDTTGTNDVSKFYELFSNDRLLELCNSFWTRLPKASKDVQPYLRGCKWSPDGTCCLCVVNHDGFHIMELPRDLYEGCPTRDRMITLLPAVIHVKESGIVYDFCWYPKMNSHYPETCSWISTKINSPIQMWDAYDGSLKCSYRGFNAVDEMEPALSVTFINQGQRIVGGYKNCLRTFDVERPGRDFLQHKIKSPASCFATHENLLAVGSWNANINLFSILDNGTYRSVGNLHAHSGGITHLQFTSDGTKLVSGARKDDRLCVWDIRYYKRPLNILKRSVTTNQRIYFDISNCGRYLVSGGTDGLIRVWDDKVTKWTEKFNVQNCNQESATYRFPLYRDCCNSVSIHPSRPILATGSGQFHFVDPVKILESECDNGNNCDDGVPEESQPQLHGSSDAQTVQNTDVSLIEINKTNSANQASVDTAMEQDSEISTLNDSALETSIEEPPAKRSKRTDDIDETVSAPIVETCIITTSNVEHINEKPPTTDVISNEDENITSQREIDKEAELIKDVPLTLSKECDVINTEVPLDCNSKINSGDKSIIQDTSNSQSQVTKLDKVFPVPINKDIVTSENETQKKFELVTFSESNLFEVDTQPINISNEYDMEKLSDGKRIIDSTLDSDNDYYLREKKMKYSPYAENNLTFWWTAKIFEQQST